MTRNTGSPLEQLGSSDGARVLDAVGRGATRRDILGMLGAGGMAATTADIIFGSAKQAVAQTPRRGGRIRASGTGTSAADTLDPARQSFSTDYARCNMFYNGLTQLDGTLVAHPALAESWENQGARVWTFRLRRGVEFHDGKPLTSADVVYSLNRHKDPATASRARSLAMQMTEIVATGPQEVRITLEGPNADLPVLLGTFHFKIVKDGTTDFSTAIGTGPFRCREFQPGVRSIAVRNPNYWSEGRPYLDEVEFIGIADEQARVNALLSGDVQLIGGVDPRSVRRLQQAPGTSVFETKSGYYTNLVMRLDMSPGNNPDFVLGMKYLFDRQQIRTAILRNYGVIGNDQPIDPGNRYHFAGLPQRPFDLDRARFHFQRSGVGSTSLPLVCSTAAPNSIDMAQVIQQTGSRIGLNFEVRRVPADGYWSNHWFKHPLGFGAINPRPTADLLLTLFFKSDAAWNESAWRNERFDQLLLAARGETDEARRRQLYADMQVMIHNESGIGIPVFQSLLDGHSSRLRGLGAIPVGSMMGFDFAQHVWLES
jgi:peptide/nickel transport system substrate-binding protein